MNESKFVKGVVVGAIAGAGISLLDKATRKDMKNKMKSAATNIKHFAQNPDDLKAKFQDKADKFESIFIQLSQDAQYFSGKVSELKTLTPQVKTLVTDTKDAFVQSKEEYKTIVKDEEEIFMMPELPKELFAENHLN